MVQSRVASREDIEAWHRELRAILNQVADAMRALGIARDAVGVSDAVHEVASDNAETRLEKIAKRVRRANELATRVEEAPLTVPGAPPEVDLRPWWSKLLNKVSSTARRQAAAEGLETLRLEADAAMQRAASRLR
jgi:hypothetical protein